MYAVASEPERRSAGNSAIMKRVFVRGRAKQMGIAIFESVSDALRAGYTIESPYPDSEGFLHARIHTAAGWAKALVACR